MKENESRTVITGGRHRKSLYKMFVASLLAAFVLASFPMSSAFAAPAGPDDDDWERKQANLRAEMSILNNLVTQPGKFGTSEEQAKYRDKYIATMRAAQALLVSGGNVIPVTGAAGDNNTGNQRGGYYQRHPKKLLAMYLHQMRKLREKMGVTNRSNIVDTGNNSGTGTDTGTDTTSPSP